uniref:E2F-associated phosphoprotein n=1 Tax=Ciona intestinalis TaxID=7719 RepID=F6YLL6_CIOIN
GEDVSSSEDEFERTMKDELDEKMKTLEESWIESTKDAASCSTSKQDVKQTNYYDNVYFDSDEETAESERGKEKKKVVSNADLFYDPQADDDDQIWINKQKERGKIQKSKSESSRKPNQKESPQLSCPACMATVCLDCQRHDTYQNQYRAMFVLNCTVHKDEVLHYKGPKKKVFKRHKRYVRSTDAETNQQSTNDSYHPVKCETCKTEIAVYDKDDVFHFFNVIAG